MESRFASWFKRDVPQGSGCDSNRSSAHDEMFNSMINGKPRKNFVLGPRHSISDQSKFPPSTILVSQALPISNVIKSMLIEESSLK